ncbi:hypothetical protein IHE44_0003916 [Lamprotornis superbus]|uniref:MAX dimerization protein 3 n=1 Tax=Lamprotornis superbus TaxID=245042 RepID=A0A835NX56_9PASS|nr:hypothetical protein IHE44_0003916 [Lamprotornis superbus]
MHNALEKHRYGGVEGEQWGRGRAQLRCCLERLKQQVPVGTGPSRSTTLSLLHRARLHIQRLEEQELRARRAKDQLRDRQRSLQRRLELLLLPTDGERARADSLDSSRLSEPSEEGKKGERKKERGWAGRESSQGPDPAFPVCPEDAEVEVDGVVFSGDLLPSFGTGRDHSYSSPHSPAS